jgi:hypothetical protein
MSGEEIVISSFKDAKKVHLGLFFAEDKKANYNCLVIAYLRGNLATVECWPTDDIRTGMYTETMMRTEMKFPFTCIAKILDNESELDNAIIEGELVEGFFIFKKEVSNKDIL